MLKVIIIGIVVTIVGLFVLSGVDKKARQNNSGIVNNNPTTETVNTLNGDEVNVSITGEVNHPGTYSIGVQNTLGDLIMMAGGVTSKADPSTYNTGLIISTYTSFYIPPLTETPSVCVETTINKVNINTGTKEELIGIGFNTSQAPNLIDYRNENGPFKAIEDILKVKGIGEATFSRVKNRICIS
jgi:competence protein ComEA